MKYVRLFEGFKEDDIHTICDKYGIENYIINSDGSIDVDGSAKIGVSSIPIKFRRVNIDFNCSYNKLKTLEGSPNYVGGHFICNFNNLITLQGAPNHVGASFYCYNNKLTTLEFSPNYVGRDFYCSNNRIMTFEGAPNHIGGAFLCNDNPIWEIWLLFRDDYSKVELLNDYDALRIEDGKGICILSRLNGFLEDIGKPKLTDKQIKEISKHYEIR